MFYESCGCLFRTEAQCLVNTVNCVGPMGRGIALEFKKRYPDMYAHYRSVCQRRLLRPGMILPYTRNDRLVLNFAVKDHWRNASSHAWIEDCLRRFVANYERLGVTSVALPRLGAENGWIPWEPTYALIQQYLGDMPIRVELVHFDPSLGANEALAAACCRKREMTRYEADILHGFIPTGMSNAKYEREYRRIEKIFPMDDPDEVEADERRAEQLLQAIVAKRKR